MAFPYKTISKNIDSVNSGSFYDESDLNTFLSGSTTDKYFGTSEQDVIEFSVYDIDENLQLWKTVPVNSIYNVNVIAKIHFTNYHRGVHSYFEAKNKLNNLIDM
jgi:hypothetical protein